MELEGQLHFIGQTTQRTESFKSREFVLVQESSNYGTTYKNYIKFQLLQDKTALVDAFKVGQKIKVQFNIKGSEYTKDGKTSYFNNLDAWKIEGVGNVVSQHQQAPPPLSPAPSHEPSDLPF